MTARRWQTLLAQISLTTAIVAVWEVVARSKLINPMFIGRPTAIAEYMLSGLQDGSLLRAAGVTLAETLTGFLLGLAIGSAIGLALWWSPLAGRVTQPLLVVFNAIPKIALAPIFIVLLGVGFWMKTALAFTNVVVLAALTAYVGARQADADLIDLIRAVGGNRWRVFTTIVVPTSMTWVVSTLEICLGLAFIGAVTGEFLAAREGLGYLALYGSNVFNMNLVWVAVLAMMIVTVIVSSAIRRLERHLLSWKPSVNGE